MTGARMVQLIGFVMFVGGLIACAGVFQIVLESLS